MFDTWNPAVLNNQLEGLSKRVTGLKEEIETIVPDFSTEETNTGQKWIDGKYIYMITLTGTTPASGSVDFPLSFDNIIKINGIVESTYGNKVDFNKQMVGYGFSTKDNFGINASTQPNYQNTPYHVTVFYTKPDPVPEP